MSNKKLGWRFRCHPLPDVTLKGYQAVLPGILGFLHVQWAWSIPHLMQVRFSMFVLSSQTWHHGRWWCGRGKIDASKLLHPWQLAWGHRSTFLPFFAVSDAWQAQSASLILTPLLPLQASASEDLWWLRKKSAQITHWLAIFPNSWLSWSASHLLNCPKSLTELP